MPKVLIVDDSSFMRLSLKTVLENGGMEVVGEAENGSVAVKKYIECRPDVVTMDITMPGMDGIQALQAIRQHDPNAKVLMVSAMGQEKMVKEAILNGAKSFIVKPYKENYLLETIEKILS